MRVCSLVQSLGFRREVTHGPGMCVVESELDTQTVAIYDFKMGSA